jgi:hypothetical protein
MTINTPPVPVTGAAKRGSPIKKFLWSAILFGIGGFALWTWAALSWSYSDGDRAGVVQKFSRKGWICKTWEGELAQYVVAGVAPQIWPFSVRDPQVAAQISQQVGAKVDLHYSEHKGVPLSCFAETSYFVERVTPSR